MKISPKTLKKLEGNEFQIQVWEDLLNIKKDGTKTKLALLKKESLKIGR